MGKPSMNKASILIDVKCDTGAQNPSYVAFVEVKTQNKLQDKLFRNSYKHKIQHGI